MKDKNAIYLLFEHDFGNGPLFRNQTELVNEFISSRDSSYHSDVESEIKSIRIRLKTYLSQLLSDSTKRNISPAFVTSLKAVLKKKKINDDYGSIDFLHNEIIESLKNKNRNITQKKYLSEEIESTAKDFISNIIDARYITIFTSRDIRLEFEIVDKRMSLIDFLLNDLLSSITQSKDLKLYRFNFHRKETCMLFWHGLRKELTNYLEKNKNNIISFQSVLKNFNIALPDIPIDPKSNESFEQKIAVKILEHLSNSKKICVFQISVPVFTVPVIALNPNDFLGANAYIMLLNEGGQEKIHKMTIEEFYNWKLFVWEYLKTNKNDNKLIEFSGLY
jgi:hypothetical protein